MIRIFPLPQIEARCGLLPRTGRLDVRQPGLAGITRTIPA